LNEPNDSERKEQDNFTAIKKSRGNEIRGFHSHEKEKSLFSGIRNEAENTQEKKLYLENQESILTEGIKDQNIAWNDLRTNIAMNNPQFGVVVNPDSNSECISHPYPPSTGKQKQSSKWNNPPYFLESMLDDVHKWENKSFERIMVTISKKILIILG